MNIYRELKSVNGYVTDPFNQEEVLIYKRSTGNYFLKTYGLTLEQVWNICNGYPKDEIHKCPICGRELKFRNLNNGYYSTCSFSCRAKLAWTDNDYSNHILEKLNSVNSHIKGKYTLFLSKGSLNDPCYFYLAYLNNYTEIKFGVSCDNSSSRELFNLYPSSFHVIFESTRLNVANLELEIKEKLNNNSEIVNSNKLSDLIKIIRNYIYNGRETEVGYTECESRDNFNKGMT